MIQGIYAYNNPYALFNLNTRDLKQVQSPAQAATTLLFGGSVGKTFGQYINYDRLNSTQDFYAEFREKLGELDQAAEVLSEEDAAIYEERVATVSDDAITVNVEPGSETGELAVEVTQLAANQINRTRDLEATAETTLDPARNTLDITVGDETITLDIARSEGQTNAELLTNIADAVNAADLDITARTSEDDTGQIALEITGNKTGQDATFIISGDLAEGLELNVVDQLATNATGTINNEAFSTVGNKIQLVEAGYSLTLNEATEAPVYVKMAVSGQGAISTAKRFANSFNRAIAFLRQAGGGAGLIADQLQVTAERHVQELEPMGFSMNTAGEIEIEEDAFTQAFEDAPEEAIEQLTAFSGLTASTQRRVENALQTPISALRPAENRGQQQLLFNYQQNSNRVLLNQFTGQGSVIDVLL